jgi:dihydrofolate reductase/thymidylate synthase
MNTNRDNTTTTSTNNISTTNNDEMNSLPALPSLDDYTLTMPQQPQQLRVSNNNNNYYQYSVIVAHSVPEFAIGKAGNIPWYIPEDLQHFKEMTTTTTSNMAYDNYENKVNILVMGRKTWESIPQKVRPLSNRHTIIITRNEEKTKQMNAYNQGNSIPEYWCSWDNLSTYLDSLRNNSNFTNQVFFCGGSEIYELALRDYPISQSLITEVYINQKKAMDQFDTFFPNYKPHNWLVNSHQKINPDSHHRLFLTAVSPFKSYFDKKKGRLIYYRFKKYGSAPKMTQESTTPWVTSESEEQSQYMTIMRNIMRNGIDRGDRTGTGTISLFGTRQCYDLRDTFPLSTTKRIFFRAVFEELKLYLSGRTDNGILQERGIHIWDGNTSREFLDSRGLQRYPEGDMGETYGFNFRHFAGDYVDCHTSYPLDGTNGYDQLENVINLLKNDPTSRRIIINLWNPATLHKAALPSCLMMYQFYVDTHAKLLHCQIYIRSSDYFLANNWNTCTGALLVHMLCALEGINLTPGSITTITGDTHIYKTHLEQVNKNLEREPVPFPKLVVENAKSQNKKFTKLEDIEFDDLQLWGYIPQPNISAPMAV